MERHELARLLGAKPNQRTERTVLAESNPEEFIAAFSDAVAGEGDIFLVNPRWGGNERGQAAALIEAAVAHEPAQAGRGWLMIPTGGSSGFVKFARHDGLTIAAAVRGFAQHFGLRQINAVGGLPLHHVSGLIGWLRTVLTGGLYLPAEWEEIEAGLRPKLSPRPDGWIISLVPTQLERLLRDEAAVDWLRQFRIGLVGGAPAWPALLDRAAEERIPIALTYGMTETAALVTAVRPQEFLMGERSSGKALPHVRVNVDAEGAIVVSGESVFLGYYPHWREAGEPFTTADRGEIDEGGRLHVHGRRDAAIITGGEKVHPADVEAVLQIATGVADVRVLGVADAEWGERVVAAYPAACKFSLRAAREAAEQQLSPAQRPKSYVALAEWPVSEIGKVQRSRLAELVQAQLRTGAAAVRE
jgi:o-succinylbenzoate---CoA ligase